MPKNKSGNIILNNRSDNTSYKNENNMSELNQNKIANLFSMDTIDSCNPTNVETKNECWGNKY